MSFDNVQFADNPPDKQFTVKMLIPCGLGIVVARSTRYLAYTGAKAIAAAKKDNPNSFAHAIVKRGE